jgi:hypothetical protein
MTTMTEEPPTSTVRVWALAGSGVVIAAVGGVWWAWDADSARGRLLVIAGLLIAAAGYSLTRKPGALPIWVTNAAAALLVLVAGYELWEAISTIASQAAPRGM